MTSSNEWPDHCNGEGFYIYQNYWELTIIKLNGSDYYHAYVHHYINMNLPTHSLHSIFYMHMCHICVCKGLMNHFCWGKLPFYALSQNIPCDSHIVQNQLHLSSIDFHLNHILWYWNPIHLLPLCFMTTYCY